MEQQIPVSASEQQACDSGQQQGVQRYSDEFMMYVFKVEMCKRVDKHDREKCPYAHPGELARRRHPSLYKALPCPEARAKKICPRLENCNCSHSTFEFWLHPDRFKTFLCERGSSCNRPICFFAHSESELRELPQGLQRPRSPHKPHPSAHSSTAGGAGSSRQAAGLPHGPPGATVMLMSAGPGGGGQMTYLGQQGAPGYHPQQQQLPEGSEQGGQVVMNYVPVMEQQGAPPQGLQYVSVPVQQGGRLSDAGLGGAAAAGPQSPQLQVLQQGQLMYGPAGGDGQRTPSAVQAGHSNQQLQLQFMSYPPQQVAYGMQPAPPGQYGAPYGPPSRQQVTIGYQPVQVGGMQGYTSPQGVVMVRPAPQRGATVAVIPAGPSAWSGSLMSADSGEAPSLEALCAAMNYMAVPTTDAQPDLLLQQYQQQAGPGQQQQQVMAAAPQMQAAAAGASAQPQGVQLYAPAAQGVQQVLVAAPGRQQLQQEQQQHSGPLLPGHQVVMVMPQDGSAVQGSQLGWGGIGGMQPGM